MTVLDLGLGMMKIKVLNISCGSSVLPLQKSGESGSARSMMLGGATQQPAKDSNKHTHDTHIQCCAR